MYPLAPVRRMRDVLGIAAGFSVDLLAPLVSDVFTSELPSGLRPLEGVIPPLPVLQLFLLHALLDQFTGRKILLVPRIRGQCLLNGSQCLGILFSPHCD
jgi:hypothetical protein